MDTMMTWTGKTTLTTIGGAYQWPELLAGLTLPEIINAFFNITFILLVGLVLWSLLLKGRTGDEWRRQRGWTIKMLWLYTVMLFASAAMYVHDSVGFKEPERIVALLLDTTTGFSWLLLLVTALIGLVCLHRIKLFDTLWLLAVVLAKTQLGHASAVEDRIVASLMTGIHVLAASLWAGGLLLILLLWRKYRYDAERLMPTLSGAALAALMLLATTGLINSIIYLPDLSYVLETRWGLYLLLKLGIVVLVTILAAFVRRRYTHNGVVRLGALLRLDLLLMLVVIVLGASMSGADPVPGDKPLNWHVDDGDMQITAEVSPNTTGANTFVLTVWLPEKAKAPRTVDMRLHGAGAEAEPVEIALKPAEHADETLLVPGFTAYDYVAESDAISESGKWRMEITVAGVEGGGERKFEHLWRVYH